MYDVDKEYTDVYYGNRMAFKEEVYPRIAREIQRLYAPSTVIDVGCGNGVLMDGFDCLCLGIEASHSGVTKTSQRGHRVIKHDLRLPIRMDEGFDLAVSIEVAEHLEEQYAGVFVDNMVSFSDNIVLTASSKVERYHYNPQNKGYWINLFESRGFFYSNKTDDLVEALRSVVPRKFDYLYHNLMCFSAKSAPYTWGFQ